MSRKKVSDRELPVWATVLSIAIRQRRKAHGLTQQELADAAGCSKLAVWQLEAGKPTARLDLVMRVVMALGIELRLQDGGNGIVDHS